MRPSEVFHECSVLQNVSIRCSVTCLIQYCRLYAPTSTSYSCITYSSSDSYISICYFSYKSQWASAWSKFRGQIAPGTKRPPPACIGHFCRKITLFMAGIQSVPFARSRFSLKIGTNMFLSNLYRLLEVDSLYHQFLPLCFYASTALKPKHPRVGCYKWKPDEENLQGPPEIDDILAESLRNLLAKLK